MLRGSYFGHDYMTVKYLARARLSSVGAHPHVLPPGHEAVLAVGTRSDYCWGAV